MVTILAYNEEESILGAVDGLRQNASFVDYVVANDSSADGTCALLEEYRYHPIDPIENLG